MNVQNPFMKILCDIEGKDIMRNVIITGASRGIGAEIARAFAKNGDRVFIIYEKSREAAEKLASDLGGYSFCCDVGKKEQVEAVREEIKRLGFSIDIIINNAGVSQIKMFSDITEDDWDRVMDVNIKGAFLVTQSFLPDLISKKSGKIINISSIWGETGASCEVHYSASKAALIGFTKALAKELGLSGICVNAICPGVIETDMNKELGEDVVEQLKEEIPLSRMGSSSDVAKTCVFLASEAGDYITGQVISVNGGMYI